MKVRQNRKFKFRIFRIVVDIYKVEFSQSGRVQSCTITETHPDRTICEETRFSQILVYKNVINGTCSESVVRTNLTGSITAFDGTALQYDIIDAIKTVKTRLHFQLEPMIAVGDFEEKFFGWRYGGCYLLGLTWKEWGISKKFFLGGNVWDVISLFHLTLPLSTVRGWKNDSPTAARGIVWTCFSMTIKTTIISGTRPALTSM